MLRPALIAAFLWLCPSPGFAGTPEQEAALRDIEVFTVTQQKSDPLYAQVEAELLKQVDEVITKQPANEWAPTLKRMYFGVSARVHSEERARIRDREQITLARTPASAAADALTARMEALEKDLFAGKLGPREHALHVLEAARFLYPSDGNLIAWREAKVPIATDYELGKLTLAEYDERWSRATAVYRQNTDAREQAIAAQVRYEAAAEYAAKARTWQGIADRFRQDRPVRCTSTPGALGTNTVCR